MSDGPDHLDAVTAAPEHHRHLFENDRVRVLHTRIDPGEMVPLHTHRWPALYQMIAWSHFVRRDETGAVVIDTTATGLPAGAPDWYFSPALGPHTLENVGDGPIELISIELKDCTERED